MLVLGAASVGLYAAAIAVAEGASRVDYVDDCKDRLELAERLGARPIELKTSRSGATSLRDLTVLNGKRCRYSIAVDARADAELLSQLLTRVEPGGVCTSPAMYFKDLSVPIAQMFSVGVRFHTGRGNARASVEPVLELVRSGKVRTDLVTSETLPWDALPDALTEPSIKPVFSRS